MPLQAPPESSSASTTSGRVQQLLAAAKQALLHGSFPRAHQLLSEAINIHPGSYKLHRLRAVASACLEDYEAALDDAEAVVELMPGSPDGYYHKGFALFQLRDYAGAAHAFNEGLALNPADKVMQRGFWDAVNLMGQSAWQEMQQQGSAQQGPPAPRGLSTPTRGGSAAAAASDAARLLLARDAQWCVSPCYSSTTHVPRAPCHTAAANIKPTEPLSKQPLTATVTLTQATGKQACFNSPYHQCALLSQLTATLPPQQPTKQGAGVPPLHMAAVKRTYCCCCSATAQALPHQAVCPAPLLHLLPDVWRLLGVSLGDKPVVLARDLNACQPPESSQRQQRCTRR